MEIWVCTCFMIINTSRGKNSFSLTMTWSPWIVREGERTNDKQLGLKYTRKGKGGQICACVCEYTWKTQRSTHPPVSCMIYLWIEQSLHYLRGKTSVRLKSLQLPPLKRKKRCQEKDGVKKAGKKIPFFIHSLSTHNNIF